MLRIVGILGIVALIGILSMVPGLGNADEPPGGGGGGYVDPGTGGGGGYVDPGTGGGGGYVDPGTGGGGGHVDPGTGGGGGHVDPGAGAGGGLTGPTGSFTGPTGSFTGPTGSFTGPTGSFTGPTGSFTGPTGGFTGPTGSVPGPEGGAFPGGAIAAFGAHGAPAGFTFGSFSGPGGGVPGGGHTAGVFPGGGATAGQFPGSGATAGAFPGGGATGGGFPGFLSGFQGFVGGPGSLPDLSQPGGGLLGPPIEIKELGLYGNFGVIGEQKAGGAVGNYGLLDRSGHVLDVSGFGKGFGDFFNRSDSALAAVGKVEGLKPEDISVLGGGFAAGALKDTDFLGFHAMDPSVLAAMFQHAAGPGGPGGFAPGGPGAGGFTPGAPGPGGLAPGGLQLRPEQWAGAFGAMKPEDIKGLGNVVGDAVGSLGSKDFLAIPPDQVLAMLQGSVLKFDPQAGGGLQQNLQQYGGKLDGMLGAMSFGQYKQIDPGAMVGMMQTMNLGGQGFDLSKTALQGKDVASMFGALNQERLGEFGGEKVLGSIKDLQKGDFGDLDAKGALNIFNTIGSDKALSLANLGGIVGRFDAGGFQQLGNQGTFGIAKALARADFEALDKSAALGAAATLNPTQLAELDGRSLAGLITGVSEGVFNLDAKHVEGFLKGIGGEVVATLGQGVAGNLVGAAGDADLLSLPPDVQGAYLSTLAADRLGAAGFGAAGAADTVFNIVPAGAYSGKSLSEVIGAAGAPTLFGGKLFGSISP